MQVCKGLVLSIAIIVLSSCDRSNDVTDDEFYVGSYKKGMRLVTLKELVLDKMKNGEWALFDPKKVPHNWKLSADSKKIPKGSEIIFRKAKLNAGARNVRSVDLYGELPKGIHEMPILLNYVSVKKDRKPSDGGRYNSTRWRYSGPNSQVISTKE